MNRTQARRLVAGGTIIAFRPARTRWYEHIVTAGGATAALALFTVVLWLAIAGAEALLR